MNYVNCVVKVSSNKIEVGLHKYSSNPSLQFSKIYFQVNHSSQEWHTRLPVHIKMITSNLTMILYPFQCIGRIILWMPASDDKMVYFSVEDISVILSLQLRENLRIS